MKTKTGRIGAFAAACIGVAALTGAAAAPAQAAPQTSAPSEAAAPLGSVLYISVICDSDKNYSWNVTYYAGAPGTTYPIYAEFDHETGGGFTGGGSSFSPAPLADTPDSVYSGVLTTGNLGVGTSGTNYGYAGPDGTRVTVTVSVDGHSHATTANC